MPRWPRSEESASSRGTQRYLPRRIAVPNRRPRSRAAKSAPPARCRRTARGCRTSTASTVRPAVQRSRPRRTTSTSGSSGTAGTPSTTWRDSENPSVRRGTEGLPDGSGRSCVRVRRRAGRGVGGPSVSCGLGRGLPCFRGGADLAPGGLGRLLLRFLLATTGAGAVRDTTDASSSSKGLLVVGAGLRDEVLGNSEALARGELLETGLPVQAGSEVGGPVDQRVEEPVDQLRGRAEALVEIDGADHRFKGVGEDGSLVPATRALFTAAEPDEGAEFEAAAHFRKCTRVDHRGPQLGQLAFGQVGVGAVQRVRDHQAENRVPEEFESLVGGQTAVLVCVRTVGQRTHQKGGLEVIPEPPFQKRVGRGCVDVVCLLLGAGQLRHRASHQPLRPRGPGACCRCRSSGTQCAGASAPGNARTKPGWGPQPSTATGGGACCCATSSASEQPRLLLLLLVDARFGAAQLVLLAIFE